MLSRGMLHHVAAARTGVWEECITFIIRVTRTDELGTTLGVTSNRSTLQINTIIFSISSQHASVASSQICVTTWRNIPEDGIPHSHCRENFKYIALTGWTL
jgi:hypothetical protein